VCGIAGSNLYNTTPVNLYFNLLGRRNLSADFTRQNISLVYEPNVTQSET
jgi:hypothetical protein